MECGAFSFLLFSMCHHDIFVSKNPLHLFQLGYTWDLSNHVLPCMEWYGLHKLHHSCPCHVQVIIKCLALQSWACHPCHLDDHPRNFSIVLSHDVGVLFFPCQCVPF